MMRQLFFMWKQFSFIFCCYCYSIKDIIAGNHIPAQNFKHESNYVSLSPHIQSGAEN